MVCVIILIFAIVKYKYILITLRHCFIDIFMLYFTLLSRFIFLICFVDEAETVYKEHYIPGTLILTVYSMCREEALITFLEHAIM